MEVETLSPFTPPPDQPDKTPIRHKRKRPTTTPTTTTSARQPQPTPSVQTSPPIKPPCPPPPTSASLLSLPPRCPTPSCPHHGGFRVLCAEWLYGTQYVLTCPACHAIIYPCDCCHQVAAHPATSASYSACSECGFLTVISPQLRRVLRLPPLLPLSSSTTLSIQSSISLPFYQQQKRAAYQSAFTAYQRAEQRRKRANEVKDGGESDTTEAAIRPAQPTLSSAKKRKKADPVLPKAGESTLLRLREELIAIEQLTSVLRLAPPSFTYGVQPLDSVPFTSHHLHSLHTSLLALQSSSSLAAVSSIGWLSSSSLAEFHTAAVDFFSARTELMSYIRKVRQGWSVLQRVQRTYAELWTEEGHHTNSPANQPTKPAHTANMHTTDDEADEHDEHKTTDQPATTSAANTVATHSKAVQRGVMAIVLNVLSCRLQHTCHQLHTRAVPHLPLLSAINRLLLPLYTRLQSTLDSMRAAAGGADVLGVEWCEGEVGVGVGEVDGVGGECGVSGDELLLWCSWLLRCCYCGVSSALQCAVYWSDILHPTQQSPSNVAADKRGENGASEVAVAVVGPAEEMPQPTSVMQ